MSFAGYDDMDACMSDHSDKEDPGAYCAQIHYEVTGEWPAEKYEKEVFPMPIEVAELAIKRNDVPKGTWDQIPSDSISPFRKLAASLEDPRRFKSAIDMVKLTKKEGVEEALSKSDAVEKVNFDAQINRSVSAVFKQDDEFLIWGPASVEVVDKEDDKVNVEALDKALPQLLKRASLSYAHTDQLVGRILERFATDEPVEVTIDGNTYKRDEFPTAVLDLDDGNPPGMFVAGEVFDDTNQSREVRQKIEEGEINSYSISGEALVTQKQIDGNKVYDDILEMDLSAVTLCEEGMNQDAKFARVNGDVSEVEHSEPGEKSKASYEVENGSVSSPDQVQTAVAKSMRKEEQTEEKENGVPSDFNPDEYLKQDEVGGEIATKQDLNKRLEKTVEKTVEEIVKEVEDVIPSEDDVAEKAESAAQEAVKSSFPDGDLATVGYIQENFQQKGDDYEEEEMEEEEEEDDDDVDIEEAEEVEASDEDGDISREQLKEDLPEDVWKVVSEYVGDTKQKSTGEEEDAGMTDIEKAVADVLEGKTASSPGVDLGDREDELDERFEKEEEETSQSPALNKWR
jgi:hypothetical protein